MIIIDWEKVENMTSEEIENLRIAVSKEIQIMRNNKQLIQDEYNRIKKQVLNLQIELHHFKTLKDKSSHNISQQHTDEDILRSKFWNKRN